MTCGEKITNNRHRRRRPSAFCICYVCVCGVGGKEESFAVKPCFVFAAASSSILFLWVLAGWLGKREGGNELT